MLYSKLFSKAWGNLLINAVGFNDNIQMPLLNKTETSKKIIAFSLENPRNSLVLQASFGRSV